VDATGRELSAGQFGTLQVTHGKTAAARLMLPVSPRVRALLKRRWEAAKMHSEGWVWAKETASRHVEPSTMKKRHQTAEGAGRGEDAATRYSIRDSAF